MGISDEEFNALEPPKAAPLSDAEFEALGPTKVGAMNVAGSDNESAGLNMPLPTGQQRQRAYRETVAANPNGATNPDLYKNGQTAGETLHQYGQVAKGLAKGIPATLSGGMLGDIEQTARMPLHDIAPATISRQPVMPTTEQGGYLGPKGFGVMSPAANPEEAAGMNISGALVPGFLGSKFMKGPKVVTSDLPTTPPGGPIATVREGSGARLLPPETPHTIPEGTSSVGAAQLSPLEGISPETIDFLKQRAATDPVSPFMVDQRLEEMSPHQSLAEFSPSTLHEASGLAQFPGAHLNELKNFYKQRSIEAPERVNNLLDSTFGDKQDLSQMQRVRDIERSQASTPLYEAWRKLNVPEYIGADGRPAFGSFDDPSSLMSRLDAANAFGNAKRKAKIEGIPWQRDFGPGYGPIEGGQLPTAQTWDYVKRALDQDISGSFDKFGRATDDTRIFTKLKMDLLSALDNHTNPQIAGVYKQARDSFITPSKITDAERLGKKILSMDPDEVPFLTAGHSAEEMLAIERGMRKDLANRMGKGGPTERGVVRQLMSPNAEQIVRWVSGDKKAEDLLKGLQSEADMHAETARLRGEGSPTAGLEAAKDIWRPKQPLDKIVDVGKSALGAVHNLPGAAVDFALRREGARGAAKMNKIMEEAARIYTLQGPERDAVARYLMAPDETPHANGGRVARAAGGMIVHSNINHRPTEAQKEAGNYAKDHVNIHGLSITIENAQGKNRSGVSKDGKKWSVRMPAHYGYIKRTNGADGDHVDCYVGPNVKSNRVFIIDQANAENGKFDEHKCMIGFDNRKQATDIYKRGFSDGLGHKRLGHIAEMSVANFKDWLNKGDTTKPVERTLLHNTGGRTVMQSSRPLLKDAKKSPDGKWKIPDNVRRAIHGH